MPTPEQDVFTLAFARLEGGYDPRFLEKQREGLVTLFVSVLRRFPEHDKTTVVGQCFFHARKMLNTVLSQQKQQQAEPEDRMQEVPHDYKAWNGRYGRGEMAEGRKLQ